MKSAIKTFLSVILIYCLAVNPILADTAAILPPAVTTFFDNNGNPLTSGTVTFYIPATLTKKTTWQDATETTPNTNPVVLDAAGRAIIYGSGTYRQIVKDSSGNLIWDAVTAAFGQATPGLVGDGQLVGSIKPWAGLVAPNQYAFAYGQELSRSTYSDLYTAITQSINVICSNGSNTLTGISDTSQIRIGSPLELSCVPAGTTVLSKTSASVLLSNPSNISINTIGTFFPFGNGNGTTTFNVPDLRGVAIVGRSNMGGTASTNLTSVGCPGISPDSLGANCGNQTKTLLQANLPNIVPTATIVTTLAAITGSPTGIGLRTGAYASASNSATVANADFTSVITVSSINGNVTQTAFPTVQPSFTLNYVIKILTDTSASSATGVASLGGMTGVIACGVGILCTGNIINISGSSANGPVNSVQYNNASGLFEGSANFEFISPDNLTLGAAGITGKFDIFGSSTGKVRQVAQATAGTPTIAWGNTSGTPAVAASSPLGISAITGNITISGSNLTLTNDTNITLTAGGNSTTALISAASITAGWTGSLSGARGGTGIVNTGKTLTFNTLTLSATDGSTVSLGTGGTVVYNIANGTKALATSAISSATCSAAQTATATGTLTTDTIIPNFNGDPTAVTGYIPSTSGMLAIIYYPTADTVNFKVCNNTSGSITPGAITLNWKVVR